MYSRKKIVEYFIYFGCFFPSSIFCWSSSSSSSIFISESLKNDFVVVIYPFYTRHIQTIQYILFSFLAFSNNHDMTWHEGRFYFIALPAQDYTTNWFCNPDFRKVYADATTTTKTKTTIEWVFGSKRKRKRRWQSIKWRRRTKGLDRTRYMW